MDSKPWYRRKRFWFLGGAMMTIIVVGGRYTWELVPSASYRELVREVERERAESGVYTEEPAVDEKPEVDDETVASAADLSRWGNLFGKSNFVIHRFHSSLQLEGYFGKYQDDFARGDLNEVLWDSVQGMGITRQYYLKPDEFSLEKVDMWGDLYLQSSSYSSHLVSSSIPWCIVRAQWLGDEERALQLLDRFLDDAINEPIFYGVLDSKNSSRGYNLPYLMIVLDYCGIDNALLWNRIGDALVEAESKQGAYAIQLHERLFNETETVIRELQKSPPRTVETPLAYFMDGTLVSVAQSVYQPVYTQKVRSFSGNLFKEDYERALDDLLEINALTDKMFWRWNPWVESFLDFDIDTLNSRSAQLTWLKLFRENRQSLMAITPREYATNVYTYFREGSLPEGMDLYELGSFNPLAWSFYESKEYAEIRGDFQRRIISAEDVPDDASFDGVRRAISNNLSDKMTPGVVLIQKRTTLLADPIAFGGPFWGPGLFEPLSDEHLIDPTITLWYGELAIFPDLETIREKLAP